MAFNFMESKMEKTIKKINDNSKIDDQILDSILKEIKLNLLESDVNLKVVNDFIARVKAKARTRIVEQNKKSEELLEIIREELISILGTDVSNWNKNGNSTVVMMVGLQGSGKTTSSAKIANYLSKVAKSYSKPLLVSLDVYRPAAMDQLQKLANDLSIDFFANFDSRNVPQITQDALDYAYKNNSDLIILDTAGRIQTDEDLMQELVDIKKISKPSEIIFVADGLSGQEIINVAQEFDTRLKLTSTVITKMDSNAKGGAALSITSILKVPIKFIGTGEKVNEIELFHPDRIASRILGFGDLETLQEKAKEVVKESDNERLMRKMMSNKFDLEDLLISLKQLSKMGSLKSIARLIPGAKIDNSQIEEAEEKVYVYQILLNSMTLKEKRNPKLLKHPKRASRILKGSGRTQKELNELLRQFEKSQKQMKMISKYSKNGQLPSDFGSMNGMGGF